MMAFARLSELPMTHALGWTLLHFCWQGTLVALLLASILRLLRGRSSRLRYAVACVGLILMVAMPALTFTRLAARSQTAQRPIAASSSASTPAANLRFGLIATAEPWLDHIAGKLDRSLAWVTALWFAGAILFLSRLNVGLIVTRRMKSSATEAAPAELQLLLEDLIRRLGVVRAVRLVNSAIVQVPTVIGWFRPVILLPMGCMASLSQVQVEAVIAHELAHIRRHDFLVNVLQSVVEALLFYHPAVWWVSKQVRVEREHCCDDLAVEASSDSLAYAKALSFLEERRFLSPAVALGANGGVLKMRIRRLLGSKEVPAVSRTAAATLLATVLLALGFCIAGAARAQSAAGDMPALEKGAGLTALSGPYLKWLDEDVRWIITPEEREAYAHLSDNPQRLEFIKQFWERRNPEPGSAENKFKEEHYRRTAYANMHFAAGKAGWTSDRGRVYIVNGPPDSIDSHPSGGASESKPFEVWHYHSILEMTPAEQSSSGLKTQVLTKKDVDLKFVDLCNCGEYQLQPSPNQ